VRARARKYKQVSVCARNFREHISALLPAPGSIKIKGRRSARGLCSRIGERAGVRINTRSRCVYTGIAVVVASKGRPGDEPVLRVVVVAAAAAAAMLSPRTRHIRRNATVARASERNFSYDGSARAGVVEESGRVLVCVYIHTHTRQSERRACV